MAEIELQNISKVFGGDVVAVDDVSLDIARRRVHRRSSDRRAAASRRSCAMIAGLEEVTDGEISIGGRDVTDLAPRRSRHRDGLPELRALPAHDRPREPRLRAQGAARRRRRRSGRRVEEVARLLGLDGAARPQARRSSRAASASGSRWARAIVREPQAFLMDEPLSNLDAKLRVGMRASLAQLHAAARRDDGLRHARPDRGDDARPARRGDARRADRQQVDDAAGALRAPRNLFVAAFIGSPAMNLVEATIDGRDGRRSAGSAIPLDPATAAGQRAARVILGIRPEAFEDAAFADPSCRRSTSQVVVLEELGSDAHVVLPRRRRARRRRSARGARPTTRRPARRRGDALHRAVDPRTAPRVRGSEASARRSTRRGSTSSTPRPAHHCSPPSAETAVDAEQVSRLVSAE